SSPAKTGATSSPTPLRSFVSTRSPVPRTCSDAWLQRGCGTCGFTLAQKPYSEACSCSHIPMGRSFTKLTLTIDLIDLNPYFHGKWIRIGAPIDFATGLP